MKKQIKKVSIHPFLQRHLLVLATTLLLSLNAHAQLTTADPIAQAKLTYTPIAPTVCCDTLVKTWIKISLNSSDTTTLKKIYVTVTGTAGSSFYNQTHNFKTAPISSSMSSNSSSAIIKTGNFFYVNIGTFLFREDLMFSVKTESMSGTLSTPHTFNAYNY